MKLILKYKKYLLNSASNEVLVNLDFFLNIKIDAKFKETFEFDINNFNAFFPDSTNSIASSLFEFSIKFNDVEYQVFVEKNYQSQQITLKVNDTITPDFAAWFNQVFGIPYTPELFENSILIATSFNSFEEFKNQINSNHHNIIESDLENPEIKQINEKIAELENYVKDYQSNKENIAKLSEERDQIQENLNSIEGKKEDIQELQNKVEEVDNDLSQYSSLNINEIDSQRLHKISQAQIDLQNLNYGGRKNSELSLSNIPIPNVSFQGKGILFIILIQILINISSYFFSDNKNILLLGIFGLVIQVFLLIAMNLVSNTEMQVESIIEQEDQEEKIESKDASQNNSYLSLAMVRALQMEKKRLEEVITKFTGGKSPKELEQEASSMKLKLDELKIELDKLAKFTPEQYLINRRELDIKKIERENLMLKSETAPTIEDGSTSAYNEKVIGKLPILIANIGTADKNIIEEVKKYVQNNFIENQKIYLNVS